MDLLKTMVANRQSQGLQNVKKEEPKAPVMPMVSNLISNKFAQYKAPGSKAMRKHIIEETPGKKVVKEHLEAIIARECESSSDEED